MSISRRLFLIGSALSAAIGATRVSAASTAPVRFMADTPNLYREIFAMGIDRLKASGADIDVELTWTQDYTQTLQQSLRDTLVGQGPDIALHAHNNIAVLAKRNAIVPLDDLFAGTGTKISSAIGQISGRQLAIPFSASVPVVYVNRDLIGKSTVLPSTFDAILSAAGKIDAPAGGAFFNYATDGSWTFMALIESLGGRIVNEDGDAIAFDSAEGLEAMEILAGFATVRKGQTLTASQARQAFASGAIGIHIDTTSRMRFFEEQAKGKFDLAILPFPLKKTDKARIPPSGGSLAIMARDQARQKSASRLLEALLEPDVQAQIMVKTGFIPGLAASGGIAALEADLKSSAHFDAIAPTLAVLGPWASFPVENPARVDKAVQDALDELASGRSSARQALARIVSAARQA
jgi:multiple sugar transport system substrate-binding protein